MKTKFCFLQVLIFAFWHSSFSQSTQLCGTTHTSQGQNQPSASCSNNQLLVDLRPSANDQEIRINVKIYVFVPSTNSNISVWHNTNYSNINAPTTYTDAVSLIDNANYRLSHIPVNPNLMGVPTFTNSKVRLVLTNFYFVEDDLCYGDLTSTNVAVYDDEHAINVYFGGWDNNGSNANSTPGVGSGMPNVYPLNYIKMHPNMDLTNDAAWCNIRLYGEILVHEMGHILGLNHSTAFEGPSQITPGYGCCNGLMNTTDYVLETAANNTFGSNPITNNMMSSNHWGINYEYLSPQQQALMHFNMRTYMKQFLSDSGYTAATNVNHAFDYSVTSNETWTSDRYFKGDITVKAGKILTINCGVAMSAGAKIIVEKTAALVVNGGTITNISGRSWDGIYVWGDPAKSQALNSGNTNLAQFQGWAKFYNATISHAKIGVRNHNNPWSENGGIITAYNTNFFDNYIDVEQVGPSSTPAGLASASRFYNCNFKTNTDIGDNLSPYAHVNLYRSVGAGFYGCNFEYAAGTVYNNPGYGIYSVNSKFTADKSGATPNVFKDLDRGVYVNNWNPLNVPSISNSQFINNTGYGAYFMNANTLVFQKNLVQNPGNYMAWSGVYLNNCKYYTIKSNTFTEDLNNKASVALSIYNSSAGAHQVYRNSFSKSWIGVNAMGNNSGLSNVTDGLKMNCNDFTPTANLYDIALDLGNSSVAPSVMKKQGETQQSQMSVTNMVRNMYAATCVGNNQNKWYIHSSSSKVVDHGCNATSTNGASTKPSPQPACSRTIVNTPTLSTVLNYTLHCSENNPSSGGTGTTQAQRLSTMNSYLSDLLANNTEDQNHFEIQATLASKLNLFLSDSLNNSQDSVITILNNNQGNMLDADIQTVFAYMAKGNYSEAQTKVNQLQNKKDWVDLLSKLIQVEQYTGGVFDLTADDRSFFESYATTEGKDGQSIAQAILKAGNFSSYTEPHNYPETTQTARLMSQQAGSEKNEPDNNPENILIYPNPTKTGINLYYNSVTESNLKIEIRDLLGRLIYTNFITGSLIKQYVPLDQFNKGMYLITISRNNEIINKTKIIKED